MFGLPSLYVKLGASALLVLAVFGGYKYVTGLQEKNQQLLTNQAQLEQMNETFANTIAEIERMKEVRDEVSEISHEIREKNTVIREQREIVINNSVEEGNDRQVGKVLNDFFNAE